MADLLDKLHLDAFMDRLRADPGLTVFPDAEGFTPTVRPDRYVRVYMAIDRPAAAPSNSLNGTSQTWIARYYCHCVGSNEVSAVAVAMRVRVAVLDVRPTIAGRNCGLIREDQANPPVKDDSTGKTVFDSTVVYRLTTT